MRSFLFHRSIRGFSGLAVMLAFCVFSAAQAEPVPPVQNEALAPGEIQHWVKMLDADRFQHREMAMLRLIANGRASIEPIAAALPQGSTEMAMRGVHVLQELALSDDAATEDAARDALLALAAAKTTPAARRADWSLNMLTAIRSERAQQHLERLGGKFQDGRPSLRVMGGGVVVFPADFSEQRREWIVIGPEWKGGVEGLRHLQWSGVRHVTFEGKQVIDDWVAAVKPLKNLETLEIKRANVTSACLDALGEKPSLQSLSLYYSPFDDDAIEKIQGIDSLVEIKLYGTKITPDAHRRLTEALANTHIDFRRGAFLGVGCTDHPQGCAISTVYPGSAADKGGLQVGDVILSYGGKDVRGFENLTVLIAEHASGEDIEVEILRGNQTMTKRLTLGEWD